MAKVSKGNDGVVYESTKVRAPAEDQNPEAPAIVENSQASNRNSKTPPIEGREELAEEEVEEAQDEEAQDEEMEETVDDSQPMQPVKLYFGPTEYGKACKIGSRCSVLHVVEVIEKLKEEFDWFRSHPQFKHIFHMAKEPNHMNQGLWMLLLHTAYTDKQNEAWFVVNGVPIRYSLREHSLLSGLDCHDYPKDYKNLESLKFVEKMLGRTSKIKISDVEDRLSSMEETSLDRKKMALLLFLTKVLKAKSKADGNIEPFLLRVVGDLKLCKKFPWGRYTFDDTMSEIRRVMMKFDGRVKPKGADSSFAGFILPLQILAFECIPNL